MGAKIIKCKRCGKEFERTQYHGARVYCSEECKNADYAESVLKADAVLAETGAEFADEWRKCALCGRFFKTPGTPSRYCSDGCWKEASRLSQLKHRDKLVYNGRNNKGVNRKHKAPKRKEDGFTWDDVKAVLAETGISSYYRAIEILEERKKEKEYDLQREA